MTEIPTHQSLTGFIAADPVLRHTSRGEARLYLLVGKEHWSKTADGEFTQHATTFHHLAMYGEKAPATYDQLTKADWILAEGRVRTYTRRDGTSDSEFVARRIGHDLNHSHVGSTPTSPSATAHPAATVTDAGTGTPPGDPTNAHAHAETAAAEPPIPGI